MKKYQIIFCLLGLLSKGISQNSICLQPIQTLGPIALCSEPTDFNNDGKKDICSTFGNGVYISLANTNGTYASPVIFTTTPGVTSLVTGDFNNDGNKDIVGCRFD